MPRYGMVDVTRCNGCYNCFLLVCKDEYCAIAHPGYSAPQPMTGQEWMHIIGKERAVSQVKQDYIAVPCLHCEDAPCLAAGEGRCTVAMTAS